MKDTPTAFPLFILDHRGLSGASNAAVMTISMLLALVAFALATKISRTDSFANGIQDNISLMELAMVFLFVVIFRCLFQSGSARRGATRLFQVPMVLCTLVA